MKVYRLEYEGEGLYQSDFWEDCVEDYNWKHHNHPLPDEDLWRWYYLDDVYCFDSTSVCGFTSLIQLRNWVVDPLWFKAMVENGVMLLTYEIPDEFILGGDKQCMFRPSDGVLLSEDGVEVISYLYF